MKKFKWDEVNIRFSNMSFKVKQEEDSLIFKYWEVRDTIMSDSFKLEYADNIKIKSYYLDTKMKDSLSRMVLNIITKPVFSDTFNSSNSGNIDVELKANNLRLHCNYYSVGDWTIISKDFKDLYNFIFTYTKGKRYYRD